MITREFYLKKIRPFIGNDLIKVITGVRRSGKSVMLELIKKDLGLSRILRDQMIHLNFEDMDNQSLCDATSLHEYISTEIKKIQGKAYLFFDEIQEVKEWERCINSLRVKFDCDIYITGSNAKLLSGELATYLAGRYVEFVIYPLSFAEFLDIYGPRPDMSMKELFEQYLLSGGMPYIANLRYIKGPSNQYLQDIYNSIILKDILKRNNIRDVDLLEKIIGFLMSNIGQPFSATSISKYFKSEARQVSSDTILNYIKACEEAFVFYRVRRQDLVGKKVLSTNEKYYMVDHGIREAILGRNTKDIGQVLENIVFMELLCRGYKITTGRIGDKEIDFVCEKQDKKFYVQVTYLLASEDTIKREFSAFEGIKDNHPKYVISMDQFNLSRNGVMHLNICDFLLNPQWWGYHVSQFSDKIKISEDMGI